MNLKSGEIGELYNGDEESDESLENIDAVTGISNIYPPNLSFLLVKDYEEILPLISSFSNNICYSDNKSTTSTTSFLSSKELILNNSNEVMCNSTIIGRPPLKSISGDLLTLISVEPDQEYLSASWSVHPLITTILPCLDPTASIQEISLQVEEPLEEVSTT